MVTVIVIGQGTDADTMAEQVTKPIEKAIGSVKGKKHVFSTSADGYTSVDISLDPSVDMKEAKAQVQEAVKWFTATRRLLKANCFTIKLRYDPFMANWAFFSERDQ